MSDLKIREEMLAYEAVAVLTLEGPLDQETAPEFEQGAKPYLAAGVSIIVDCSGLTYLSSSGISALIVLQTRLSRVGQSLRLVSLRGVAAQVFRSARLDRAFDIDEDVETAKGALVNARAVR